tara:strand:+ start:263 stop:841 length:579 start_codon:yes stop_codon:yes gene_type:complete
MALRSGSGGQKSKNYFVNLVKVIDVEDNSKDSKADVSIKVTIKQDDFDYSNSMFISGWHEYDEFGKLLKWKSSFKVAEFFENCGLLDMDLTDDLGQLLPSVVEAAKDNYIYTIRYPNNIDGKKYTWDRCASTLAGSAKLQKMWEIDNAKGYPRNYDAEYVHINGKTSNDSTDFPFGQNAESSELPPDIPSDL